MTKIDDRAKEAVANLSDKEIDKLILAIRNKKQNPIKWKEHNTLLNNYSITTGRKWFKLQVAQNNDTNLKYLRSIKPGQSLSIKDEKEFTKFLTYLKTGAINLGWYNAEDVDILHKLDDYVTKNKGQGEKIGKLRTTIAGLREIIISMDLSQFEESLEKFKEIYTNPHEEKDIQEFLQNNAWILGDEYVFQQPIFFSQFPMWKDKLDFFLKRYDGYYDIVEIKKADTPLFSGLDENIKIISPTRKSPMSGDLKDAISQIINYLEEANIFRQALHELNNNITIHKPRGLVIIGRNDPKYNKAITTLNDYLNDIRILTYDELYTKAGGFITRFKKGNN